MHSHFLARPGGQNVDIETAVDESRDLVEHESLGQSRKVDEDHQYAHDPVSTLPAHIALRRP